MSLAFDPANEPYVSLATFRKSGVEVRTPVWIAGHEGALYVFSAGEAGKVKRVRARKKVRLAACDVRGKVAGEWLDGTARIVADQALVDTVYPAFNRKYGWQMRIGNAFSKLAGRYARRAFIEIRLD